MKSLGQKIMQLSGSVGTRDLDEKSSEFVEKMMHVTNGGRATTMLTPGQVDYVESLHKKLHGDG